MTARDRGAAARVSVAPLEVLAKPPEAIQHDPAWVVQRGWTLFRLPRLQELIRLAIADLQSLPRHELLGRDWAPPERDECDPVAEALRACCDELRDASGMVGAQDERASHCQVIRGYIEQQPLAWSETFAEALSKYRHAAARGLQSRFEQATT